MFQKGDLIVYGNTGVCRVEEVGSLKDVRGVDPEKHYYTLQPFYQLGVIYAPVDTPVFMRPVLSRDAAEEVISRIPDIQEEAYLGKDQKLLSDHYRSFLDTHRCEDLVQIIKTVYSRNSNSRKNGKKPGQVDQRFMKRAEDLLYGEFAVSLGIPCEDVVTYISQKIESAPSVS